MTAAGAVGGTVYFPPGDYRIRATNTNRYSTVADRVSLLGAGRAATRLLLDSDDVEGYRELLHTAGSNITVSDLTLSCASEVYGTLVRLTAGSNITFRRVRFAGRRADFPDTVLHGVTVDESGTISALQFDDCLIEGVNYGFLQSNTATTTLEHVIVNDCVFRDIAAEDLAFNAPNGQMTNIVVRGSQFLHGDGFAVSLANVVGCLIHDNTFTGYGQEFVHIEDGTTGVEVRRNTFTGNQPNAFDYYSFVFIINGSNNVIVADNTFNADDVGLPFRCIYVGPGGVSYPAPTGITVSGNTATLGSNRTLIDVHGESEVTVL